ncbi:YbhB/YbcL family Raf kinase inhibitor-like protein [Sinimarinibacterium sp. CAU 1509]|uniref:YbhB/YbcL family Raf kinase inhibitor-like protein n=1 Tax=Sinimarinibacterium sp. CAU 1509 TaxID=2562283 RepID=UPI0010AD0346|nr:YbhB/YbcL family Raf kinase inhibitor-like protein [Sinimarinibacterium sp. CAU 1509]TJY59365.1 YbhB/YbcL family Raf kinase inhibitor-like protein [Sinimarinibacterium sp. CAU 1509]
MQLTSNTFRPNGRIPGRCAFAVQAPHGHVRLAANRNPQLQWSGAPAGTRSFVLTCIDADAPTRPDDVNQEGRTVPAELPRAEFVHWLMVGIPPQITEIAEGACSEGVTAKGKTAPAGPEGTRQGVNDYTGWFAGDAAMGGTYLGYDGPCPPWNDERIHHYQFEILATDLDACPVGEAFTLADLRQALDGHVLARASLRGRYSLNPAIRLR